MTHTSEIDGIPAGQVDQVVQDFRDAGAVNVEKKQQPDGTLIVIATFDDGPIPIGEETNLSWDNVPERKAWSGQLIESVDRVMPQLGQVDADAFLAGYSGLSAAGKVKFWSELLVGVAKFESSWNPHDVYHEPPPLGIDSVGLLQLSYEDRVHYSLEPISRAARSLEDPLVNLRCGVTIFATLVGKDKTVASSVNGRYRGAAAYWSVLRAGHKVDQIKALTKRNAGL